MSVSPISVAMMSISSVSSVSVVMMSSVPVPTPVAAISLSLDGTEGEAHEDCQKEDDARCDGETHGLFIRGGGVSKVENLARWMSASFRDSS